MYNMLLSIVLPVYNVERFLGECLRSIYSQCSNRIDFEVVAVLHPTHHIKVIKSWISIKRTIQISK